MTGVWTPGARNRSAHVRCVMSWVTSKKPLAEAPRAWTTRSGMRSRSNYGVGGWGWVGGGEGNKRGERRVREHTPAVLNPHNSRWPASPPGGSLPAGWGLCDVWGEGGCVKRRVRFFSRAPPRPARRPGMARAPRRLSLSSAPAHAPASSPRLSPVPPTGCHTVSHARPGEKGARPWPCGARRQEAAAPAGMVCGNGRGTGALLSSPHPHPHSPRTPTVDELLLFHTGAPELVVQWGESKWEEGRICERGWGWVTCRPCWHPHKACGVG